MKSNPFVDLREELHRVTITVSQKHGVAFKNKAVVFLGLRFIQLGCFLCGMRFEEE